MCGCRVVATVGALVVRLGEFATGQRPFVCDPVLSAHEISPSGAVLFSAYPSVLICSSCPILRSQTAYVTARWIIQEGLNS